MLTNINMAKKNEEKLFLNAVHNNILPKDISLIEAHDRQKNDFRAQYKILRLL